VNNETWNEPRPHMWDGLSRPGSRLVREPTPGIAEPSITASSIVGPALGCKDLTGFSISGSGVVTVAREVAEAPPGTVQPLPESPATVAVAIPSNCRADGVIDQRIGVDGKPYAIRFAIALPDHWNGRLLFQGGGGLDGSVLPPVGSQAAGEVPALARGFAVVSTDSGHLGTVFDATFMKDQEAALNFADASIGKVTDAAKAIIARYYGRPVGHPISRAARPAAVKAWRLRHAFRSSLMASSPVIQRCALVILTSG
jgi:hypothetical protein